MKLHINSEIHLRFWKSCAAVGDGPLWFYKKIENSFVAFKDFANSNAQWNRVRVILKVVSPNWRSPSIPTLTKLVERKRLKRSKTHAWVTVCIADAAAPS